LVSPQWDGVEADPVDRATEGGSGRHW
jgi:hypothetical protein